MEYSIREQHNTAENFKLSNIYKFFSLYFEKIAFDPNLLYAGVYFKQAEKENYNFIKHRQVLIPVAYGGRNFDKKLCPNPNILLARILTVIQNMLIPLYLKQIKNE